MRKKTGPRPVSPRRSYRIVRQPDRLAPYRDTSARARFGAALRRSKIDIFPHTSAPSSPRRPTAACARPGAIPTRTTPTTRFPARPTAARGGVRPDQDGQRNSLPPFADDPTRMSCRRTSGKPGTATAEPRMLRRSSAKRYTDNPPHRPSRPAKTTPESTLKPIRMRFSATRGAILTVLPEKPRSAVPAKANRAPIR